ncbi:hypothetical protein NLJ89_g9902 [Agrocybe chaxingu]|uniref:Uncharacterized protein n=1 Tax=Agrocybe chaxingu TaxID=84603 RepID=A0A9W8JSN0_9AGAR|nr:hypothetical protein NLJ89_g9902 [Agrocybe chaxingu]
MEPAEEASTFLPRPAPHLPPRRCHPTDNIDGRRLRLSHSSPFTSSTTNQDSHSGTNLTSREEDAAASEAVLTDPFHRDPTFAHPYRPGISGLFHALCRAHDNGARAASIFYRFQAVDPMAAVRVLDELTGDDRSDNALLTFLLMSVFDRDRDAGVNLVRLFGTLPSRPRHSSAGGTQPTSFAASMKGAHPSLELPFFEWAWGLIFR